jgi:2-polyprenyl-6-methoxyphenol hydroxylase-like FAD-dependent oxidoreductase
MNGTVLIIGGGIGGLCTALALRAKGIAAHVYERVADIRAAGAGIILAPNGLRALDRLGLAAAAQTRGVALDGLRITDAALRPLLNTPNGAELMRDFGFGMTGLLRTELYQLLLDALPADAVTLGKTLTRFDDDGARVTAHFADGAQAHGDLLIGAEGIGSAVRRQLFPEIQPRYSGQTSYRGVAEFKTALSCEAWGARVRIGSVPVSATHTYWYSTQLAPAGGEDVSKDAALRTLQEAAADFAQPFQDVIAATQPERMLRTDIADLPPLPSWQRGRVALLGDAAHATTPNLGQGGNQAIEDALALADALATYTDHRAAFDAYQRARKPRAEMVTARSRQLGGMVHLPFAPLRMARNAVLRAMPTSIGRRQNAEIFGHSQ